MKILIVTQYFWPENFRINDLAAGLKEKGHEVTVLTGMPNYPGGEYAKGYSFFGPATEEYRGIKVLRIPLVRRFKSKGINLIINYLSFVFFASLLGPWRLRGQKYDVVFSYLTSPVTAALPAILIKKVKGAKLHLWVQDLWPESLSATGAITAPWALGLVGKLVTYIYNQADAILMSSKSFKQNIDQYLTRSNTPVEYFPNSVEEFYEPKNKDADFARKYSLPQGFVIMFAGNIGYAQDFPNILQAADILRDHQDIHFVVLGDGRKLPWVKQEVAVRHLTQSVHLLGSHPAELMPQFFAHADAMLVTLKNEPIFTLTVPAKIQSYLACGKPIISAIQGEGGQIVEEAGAGISVEPGNPRALANAILKLKEESEANRNEMSQKAIRFHNQNFRRDFLISRLESWL